MSVLIRPRVRFPLPAVLAGLAVLSASDRAWAQERVLSYDSEIDVLADGQIEVTERITIRAEGREIRRGIYRDIPTRYRDRYGNRVSIGLDVLEVRRDGEPEPWFTERLSNGLRINTGDDRFLRVPAEYTFTIRYRATRQLGFFQDHDELYWNAIGTGWIFPIERGTVVVRLPEPVPTDRMTAEAYTGSQGAQGTAYTASLPAAGEARYTLTSPLSPREGMTIVLTFPKGLVPEPTTAERVRWLLADNAGVLVALIGFLLLLAFCVVRWHQVGRDPPKGVVIPRYEPSEDLTPGASRYVMRMGYDTKVFAGDLLDLAVAGHLRIHSEGEGRRAKWRLERDREPAAERPPSLPQRDLLGKLFPRGHGSIELTQTNNRVLSAAQLSHQKALKAAHYGRLFNSHSGSVAVVTVGTIAVVGIAMFVGEGEGMPAIIGVFMACLALSAVFARLVRAPTPEGRRAMDEIEGLKLYMGVAERQELARVGGPGGPPTLDAGRYESLLPYAVALEVEDAWTKQFTSAVGAIAAAEATRGMRWYSGTRPITDMGAFSTALGSSLTSSISSAASPPGSSSGSGGGGSSGGGGGGGGGGGR